MDPVLSLQDVIRCNVCDEPVSRLHENLYHIDLCKPCADKHLDKPNFPKCSKHVTNSCDNYCVQCSIPLCMDCNSSGEHQEHKIVELRKHFENQRKILQRDLEEIQKHIYPIYQTAASEFLSHKIALSQNTKKIDQSLVRAGRNLAQDDLHYYPEYVIWNKWQWLEALCRLRLTRRGSQM